MTALTDLATRCELRSSATLNELLTRLRGRFSIDPATGCWNWTGCVSRSARAAYPCMRVNGKTQRVHRVMNAVVHGPLPRDVNVLHSCDNMLCINPEHTFRGTIADNNRDRRRKRRDFWFKSPVAAAQAWARASALRTPEQRHHSGERNGQSKLTEADVRAIRSLSGTMTHREMAERFGVSRSTIGVIIQRKKWAHVD